MPSNWDCFLPFYILIWCWRVCFGIGFHRLFSLLKEKTEWEKSWVNADCRTENFSIGSLGAVVWPFCNPARVDALSVDHQLLLSMLRHVTYSRQQNVQNQGPYSDPRGCSLFVSVFPPANTFDRLALSAIGDVVNVSFWGKVSEKIDLYLPMWFHLSF